MSLKATVQVVSDERFALGEGPHWDPLSNKLYMLDFLGGDFVSVDLNDDANVDRVHFGSPVNFIIPYEDDANKFIVARNQSICQLDWSTEMLTELALVESGRNSYLNDGKCDRKGRLWTGTIDKAWLPGCTLPDECNLYSFSGQQLKHQVPNVGMSNGLDWSPDGRTMYHVDTKKRQIFSFSFDEASGSVSNQQVFFDFNGHPDIGEAEVPDGMSVDASGNIWVAIFYGGRILHIDQATGPC
ncbi:Regucalcin [Halotydeus destructor]|nr:Regucalcin [Halotydeus destructor]